MSILLKGMEMPKSCRKCFIKKESCPAIRKRIQALPKNNHIYAPYNYRHDDCPLGNVPTPHGRLIDADALLKLLDSCMFPSDMVTTRALSMATNWLKDAPTIIEAEE